MIEQNKLPFIQIPARSDVANNLLQHFPKIVSFGRLLLIALFLFVFLTKSIFASEDLRPNIVWIFGEDMGPELGAYGDKNALTPNIDALAREGIVFTRCFALAPVCSPSRSGLITGQYPTTIGTMHHRSQLARAPVLFTDYLRKAGYKVYWSARGSYGKTDFNFDIPPKAFDLDGDWTKNKPIEPFFAYLNIGYTHEGNIRAPEKQREKLLSKLQPDERHDPEKMILPPYFPDATEVRRDIANYYDLVTAVDHKVGDFIQLFKKWGIESHTIIIITGDHGAGLPRSKRWLYDSGLHVPLIVRLPENHAPTVRNDLVSFVDLAPTMLHLAGVAPWGTEKSDPIPGASCCKEMYPPLQGTVFLGSNAQKRNYVFASRDRIDQAFDRSRSVRDERFEYIKNFEPHLPYSQPIRYGESMPTMKVWRQYEKEGKLNAVQKAFFAPTKPKEELYDCVEDPYEVNNLASDPKYAEKLKELRSALEVWIKETNDLGQVSEDELLKRGLLVPRSSKSDREEEH